MAQHKRAQHKPGEDLIVVLKSCNGEPRTAEAIDALRQDIDRVAQPWGWKVSTYGPRHAVEAVLRRNLELPSIKVAIELPSQDKIRQYISEALSQERED